MLDGKPIVKFVCKGYQIENEIYWWGIDKCMEGKSMQIFAQIIKIIKPEVVWDIGANSGTYGVLAKALRKEIKVYFFEPIPKAVEMIKENLKINDFNGEVYQIALGDYNGKGEIFFKLGDEFDYTVTVNKNTIENVKKSKVMKIDVRRADTLIEEYKLVSPNLIKLDVESYEFEVLKGFGQDNFKETIFIIEILTDELARKIHPFFPSSTYDYFNINDKKKSIRKTEKIEKSDYFNYLIIPKKILINNDFKFLL
jgi:FkbM family methyltransferase